MKKVLIMLCVILFVIFLNCQFVFPRLIHKNDQSSFEIGGDHLNEVASIDISLSKDMLSETSQNGLDFNIQLIAEKLKLIEAMLTNHEQSNSTTNAKPKLPSTCAEALSKGQPSGVYRLRLPESESKTFFAYCLQDPENGPAWTIIQRRQDDRTIFYRDWQDYKLGFGDIYRSHWLGLENLYALTNTGDHELWILLRDFEGAEHFAKYDHFAIGDESTKYTLQILGEFSGNAGDSLRWHAGSKFSTKDSDNDVNGTNGCAVSRKGGWWFNFCHESHLNGEYLHGSLDNNSYGLGITWYSWHGRYYSLKYSHMAIRLKN